MPTTTLLPEVGAEIPCSCYAVNVPLTIRTSLLTLDFKGGIKVRVELHPSRPPLEAVVLKVVGHEVSAEHPELGRITIKEDDTAVTPDSVLELVRTFPPKLSSTMFLPFTLTIERPPGEERGSQPSVRAARAPLVLRTKEPAKLHVPQLSKFPPDGDLYQLENPIRLVDPDTDLVIAKIDKFPVQVGG